jgi:dienelactone hydrolase
MSPRNRAAFLGVFLAAALAAANLGCGGASATPPPPAINISLDNTSLTMLESSTAPFTATLVNDVNSKGAMWTVSCAASACGSLSPTSTASGVATTFIAPGPPASDLTVTLKASAAADATKSATATITIPALSVSVSPASATVQVASSLQISGSVNNDPGSGNVNWTLNENGNACSPGCGTISSTSGSSTTYMAPLTPPASNATVTLTADSATDATKSASASLLIPSIGITVTPAAPPPVLGTQSVPLTATLVNDKNNQGVTWTVSCPASPCGSLSAPSSLSGVSITYTAPAPPASDLQVTVTAVAVANSDAMASAIITVPAIVVDVQPQNPTVLATTTQQFTVSVTNDSNNAGVTWTVSCSATACGSVSPTSTSTSSGSVTYTAPALPLSDLSVSVIATSVTNTANSSQATVTVPAIVVSAVSPPSGIVPITGVPQFSAFVSNDPTNQGLNWTLTQNGSDCTPGCGMMNPSSTTPATNATPGVSAFNGPATLPANTSVDVNAASITDPTKFSTATLTLTNGTVQLIPATLNFSCKLNSSIPSMRCPPPSKNVVLTNTGSTALAITSISTSGHFSQTNTCSSSVAPNGSCTISVTFTSKILGTFKGTLNFADNSADAPQQINLQGVVNAWRPPGSAHAELSLTNSAAVPPPTGSSIVGTRVLDLRDSARSDPYAASPMTRELAIRLWYPVSSHSQVCQAADYTSPAVWNYFAHLLGVAAFPVSTNSCLNAAVAEGVHPIVVFTPGFTGTSSDYTFLMEDLASRGYIAVAVDHTYEATAVEFPAGRLVRSVVGSHLGGTLPRDPNRASFALDVRLKDITFVLGEIALLNNRHDGPFAGRFDLSKIVIAGHSLGGLTALLTISDPHVKGAVLIDPVLPDVLPGRTNKPVLILAADRENWANNECALWSNLQGPRLAVTLQGTEHVAFSDWIWLTKDAVQSGPMGPQKAMSAMRDYIGAFLDSNLRGDPADPLLSGNSRDYPDARVTAHGQSLCGTPMKSVTAPVHPQR